MKQKLIFRADASPVIGRGHLSRCMAIAAMLVDQMDILFVVLEENKDFLKNYLTGFKVLYIKAEDDLLDLLTKDHLLWIDGYHFSEPLKKNYRSRVKSLMETNDIPYDAMNVDKVFNHTPGISSQDFSDSPSSLDLYLGLEYAFLRPKFLEIAKKSNPVLNGEGVFICFGAADPFKLGEHWVQALIDRGFSDPIYWVSNSDFINPELAENRNITLLQNLTEDQMIIYMSKTKVLLIPSSVLSFEGLSLRKPMFTCYFVENQKLIYKGLLNEGIASGAGEVLSKDDVLKSIDDFLKYYQDEQTHCQQILLQAKLLDGKSDKRIIEAIQSNNHS
jgi:UDP-2,4-diacetamido-2,4,6-trideoxy-beta-L-altropyranose hydrolase